VQQQQQQETAPRSIKGQQKKQLPQSPEVRDNKNLLRCFEFHTCSCFHLPFSSGLGHLMKTFTVYFTPLFIFNFNFCFTIYFYFLKYFKKFCSFHELFHERWIFVKKSKKSKKLKIPKKNLLQKIF
jgi:hypothetical protein